MGKAVHSAWSAVHFALGMLHNWWGEGQLFCTRSRSLVVHFVEPLLHSVVIPHQRVHMLACTTPSEQL